jgi:uncharacterized protein (DUF58 family)
MVLAALLAVLLLSGFLSALNFRFLSFELRLPAQCFAGERVPFSVQVRNHKYLFPAFSFHVEGASDSAASFDPFYVAVIHPQGQTTRSGQATFPRRGRYAFRDLRAASRYPFGFLARERKYKVEAECLAYPQIVAQEHLRLSVLDIQGANQRSERGLGYDLYTIRDYVRSDSARHVHWKASAKTASLKTREYAAEESRRIVLVFDRFGNTRDADRFEALVSETASLAFHLIRDGAEVSLVSDEWQTPFGTSELLLESILGYLALVEMSPSARMPDMDTDSGALLMSLRRNRG